MIFPVIELVDRMTIAQLKYDKTKSNLEELEFYTQQMSAYNLDTVKEEVDNLYKIHSNIWALESELKSGVEHQLPLDEIGRRAIEIRNWNNKRISLKNTIAEKLGCVVRETKSDHLSK